MEVTNAAQARAWLQAWGPRAFKLNRAQRTVASMNMCAGLCGERLPRSKAGYLAAAKVLTDAIAKNAGAEVPS